MPSLYNIHVYETDARVSSSGYICSLCVCVCACARVFTHIKTEFTQHGQDNCD